MRVSRDDDGIRIEADRYLLSVSSRHPLATLSEPDGAEPMRLFLLAALDTDRGLDGTVDVAAPVVREMPDADGACTIELATRSTVWDEKIARLRCFPDEVRFEVEVRGHGALTTMTLLGGPYTGEPRWGGGRFHSAWTARTLFGPSPEDPRRTVMPASEPATIGVVGNSQPGRGHWFFTPAPFLFAGTPAVTADPDAADERRWQTLELRCAASDATFTELRYAPFLDGFSLELSYDGATRVEGSFVTPPVALRVGVANPYRALADHAAALRRGGLAPSVERHRPGWWTRPIFCGWGEQCRQARLEGGHPTTSSTQKRYDAWLALLRQRGVVPGTIVIDDRWQRSYGGNEPDPERWPDLRAWIAERHRDGQRVLLWFKAWDAEGLPPEACVTDGLGRPVAADPTSAAYRELATAMLRRMLGPEGLDADGLKVDFTAQTPAGPGLRRAGDAWGVALLHRLLGLIHDAAKAAKPDALVVTHAASPLFTDVTDMIRLNDLMRLDEPEPFAAAVPQMRHRARVAASIEPGMLVDTDDWCMPSLAEWRSYLAVKPELGVPALYYATGIDHSGEPFTDADYEAIAAAWRRWEDR